MPLRTMVAHRAYRAALLSNFATGWASFGLRIALVPCSLWRCWVAARDGGVWR